MLGFQCSLVGLRQRHGAYRVCKLSHIMKGCMQLWGQVTAPPGEDIRQWPLPGRAYRLEDEAGSLFFQVCSGPIAPQALTPQKSLAGTPVLGHHMGARAQEHKLPFVQQRLCSRGLKECGSSWKGIGHTQADETVSRAQDLSPVRTQRLAER